MFVQDYCIGGVLFPLEPKILGAVVWSVLFPHEPKRAILQVSSISQMQTDVRVVSVSSVACTSKQFQHYKLQFSADDNEEEDGVDNDV